MKSENSLKDPLTGVYSRSYLNTRLKEELQRAMRYKSSFSILLVDLDYFKSVNDAFGHQRGDRVLAEFSHRLYAGVRTSDLVFRYGGDEFVVLMPNTVKDSAVFMANRLIEHIHSSQFGETPPLTLTMSCGIASFPEDGQTAEDLFETADQRHYLAKRNGRACLISESPQAGAGMALDEISRLIERDEELSAVQAFLDEIPHIGRGVIRLSGAAGCGVSRFLLEAGKSARLNGFAVLALRGAAALKNRLYSVLFDALLDSSLASVDELEKKFYARDAQTQFSQIFERLLEEKGYAGVLIAMDDLPNIDRATLDALKTLYFSPPKFALGVIYADGGITAQQGFPFVVPVRRTLHLRPISAAGVQVWLRHSLRWEAPVEFVDWLTRQTFGRPAGIQAGLERLVKSGILKFAQKGWSLAENFHEVGLPAIDTANSRQIDSAKYSIPDADFVGRLHEIQILKKRILEERLVTVLGIGGLGKSRLANQVALESQGRFLNGVTLVQLGNLERAESLGYALADALKIRLSGAETARDQIIQYLQNKEILLLLDNFEHIRAGGELLAYILENTLAVRFLITSRERLGVRQEVVFELKGLDYPQLTDLQDIETFSSVQLFLQVARRVQPGFVIHEEDRPHIVHICQHLSGLPLGIELAAAWVETLSCAEISRQFDQGNDIVSNSPQNDQLKNRSLQAILISLWDMFSEAEQNVLSGLAVFRGSFSREAGKTIGGASLFFLDALINKSILRHAGQDRYLMHELLKQQLLAYLATRPEQNIYYRNRHTRYYLAMLSELKTLVIQNKEKEALSIVSMDMENCLAAWGWGIQQREITLLYPAMRGMFIFLEQRGRFQEGKEIFQLALEIFDFGQDQESSRDHELLYAKTLAILGKFDYHLGDYPLSQQRLEAARIKFSRLGELHEVAHTNYDLANLNRAIGNYAQARKLLNASLEYYREISDERSEGDILNSLGVIASGLGEIELAEEYYAAGLAKFQLLGDRGKVARALNNMGYSAMERGDFENGHCWLLESLETARDIGADPLTCAILDSLGAIYCAHGDYSTSMQYYREGLRLSMRLNALPLTLEILLGFANLALMQGNLCRAAELMTVVHNHPSAVHEIRQRASELLAQVQVKLSHENNGKKQLELSPKNVDEIILDILYPHNN